MSKLNALSGRAVDLAEYVGDNMKLMMRPSAGTLISTGAKLGAIRAGVRVAGVFLRRNPAVTIAAAAGAGLIWYAAYRRSRQAEQGNDNGGSGRRASRKAIEGNSTRVDARSGDDSASAGTSRRKSGAARKRSGGAASRSASRRRGADATAGTTH